MRRVTRTLRTKARRDIRRQRAAFAAITLTIFLGVTLFGATYDAFLNLKSSYSRAFTEYRFADLTVTGGGPRRSRRAPAHGRRGGGGAGTNPGRRADPRSARTSSSAAWSGCLPRASRRSTGSPCARAPTSRPGQPARRPGRRAHGRNLRPGAGRQRDGHRRRRAAAGRGASASSPRPSTSGRRAAARRSSRRRRTSASSSSAERLARDLAGQRRPNQVAVYYRGGDPSAALTERLVRGGRAARRSRRADPRAAALQQRPAAGRHQLRAAGDSLPAALPHRGGAGDRGPDAPPGHLAAADHRHAARLRLRARASSSSTTSPSASPSG